MLKLQLRTTCAAKGHYMEQVGGEMANWLTMVFLVKKHLDFVVPGGKLVRKYPYDC